jgi:NADH pyrophosphatase NudC (nudix superfamily)
MFVFIGIINKLPNANPKEVEEVEFFTIPEIRKMIKDNIASIGLVQEIDDLQKIRIQNK